jgi:predicted ribosome quality control (RQC) complex YloA/Tae2 family protein
MDTFSLFAFKNEIKDKILYTRINKIFQNNNIFTFKLSSNENLIFDFNTIFLSDVKLKNPLNPPIFCMFLRKHIMNSLIIDLNYFKLYRILEVVLKKGDNTYTLHINFSNKNKNLILLQEQNILANFSKFQLAEIKIIRQLDIDEFRNALINNKLEGFPGFIVKELVYLLKLSGLLEDVYEKYIEFYNFKIKFRPVKLGERIYPFLLKHLNNTGKNLQEFSSFNDMFKHEFENKYLETEKSNLKKLFKNKIKKLEKTLKKIENEIEDKKDFEKYFKFGELLKANLHLINKGDSETKVVDYYNEDMPTITIPLKTDKSPNENIENYFKKGKKFKRGVVKLKERKIETEEQIFLFKEKLYFLENIKNISELEEFSTDKQGKNKTKNKDIAQQPYKEFKFNNINIVAGKSSKGNDYIIRKFGKPDYLWFHVKDFPGSHVIIQEKEENLTKEAIEFAAKIALEYSKAANNRKGEVVYTRIKYLSKPKGAPMGLVTLKKFKTIFVKSD